jgi:nucleotide-binding universal stress UspA family protein
MKKMKILIAYDGSSHADAALDDLGRAGLPEEAEALVLSVADVWTWPSPKEDAREARAQELDIVGLNKARAQAEQAIEGARQLAVQASERIKSVFPLWKVDAEGCGDSPAWAVIKKAEEWKADLIVVGSQDRPPLSRLMLGSVSQKVLYEARCSVRVGRARSRGDDNAPRIVIGVDGSPGAEAAVSAVAKRNWPVGTHRGSRDLRPFPADAVSNRAFHTTRSGGCQRARRRQERDGTNNRRLFGRKAPRGRDCCFSHSQGRRPEACITR